MLTCRQDQRDVDKDFYLDSSIILCVCVYAQHPRVQESVWVSDKYSSQQSSFSPPPTLSFYVGGRVYRNCVGILWTKN